MRGAYKSYSSEVKNAIVRSANPNLFPELKIPESTARYWIKTGSSRAKPVRTKNRDLENMQRIVMSLELVFKSLEKSSVSLSSLSEVEISLLKVALKTKDVTRHIPRRTINLLQDKVFHCPVAIDGLHSTLSRSS